MTDFITTNLRLELDATNKALTRWTEKQVDLFESSDTKFSQTMEQFDCTLAALKENEEQLEFLREKHDMMKQKQMDEVESYAEQIEKLKQMKSNLRSRISSIEVEEKTELEKLQSVREEHEKARAQAERSLDDLTHGIKMYMALGLEFQKAESECMKFIFTNIDRANPSKKFYFLMFVDSSDQYQLVEANPLVDASYTKQALQSLNTNNDIGKFVIRMRKAFIKIAKSS
jgi:DNA repair exonuclease SbcCD ATPase subunit